MTERIIKTKAAIGSKTLWGIAAMIVPWLDHIYQYSQTIPVGVLPPVVSIALTGVGAILAIWGRLSRDIKPIEGVIAAPQ